MLKRLGVWTISAVLLALAVAALALLWPSKPSPPERRDALLETLAPLPGPEARAVPAESAARTEDGQWTMPAGDHAATRFSALDQINPGNVAELRPVFTFDTGIAKGHEAAPLVIGATMYVVTPFPNIVYALDLTRPDHPLKWAFRPKPLQRAQGVACCDVVNRGAAFADGRLFFNTLDGQTIALDAQSGREMWRTRLGNIDIGETITMAPLVAEGRVLVGSSGGEFGVRGWLAALDAGSGALLWKAWSTGPDADVLIGPGFRPFYASDRGRDLGFRPGSPKAGSSAAATPGAGSATIPQPISSITAPAIPAPGTPTSGPATTNGPPASSPATSAPARRAGSTSRARTICSTMTTSTRASCSTFRRARDAVRCSSVPAAPASCTCSTGRPASSSSADPYAYVNSIRRVDLGTGRPEFAPDKIRSRAGSPATSARPRRAARTGTPRPSRPAPASSTSPTSICAWTRGIRKRTTSPGTPYLGADARMHAGPGGNRGMLTAWDPVARRAVWRIREDLPLWSGALATGGDLVFYGTMDGLFKAVDARSGRLLWQYQLSSGTIGQPISYRGPDGRQYIAILAGVGGWSGAIVSGALDKGDPTSALGFVNAVRDLPARTDAGGRLYVFALPR
jgi:hypothetical protein